MSQTPNIHDETPEEVAIRLASFKISVGYRLAAVHKYEDKNGNLIYYKMRLEQFQSEKKCIMPFHRNEQGIFILGEPHFESGKKPIYRLYDVINSPPEITVYIVEGEWCVDHLAKLGVVATTSGGANSAVSTDWSLLANRKVVIWPDLDKPGEQYAQDVVLQLKQLHCEIKIIDIAKLNLPMSGDCVDYLMDHPETRLEDIYSLPLVEPVITSTTEFTGSIQSENQLITQLVAMSSIEYDRIRISVAEKLGVRTSTLDGRVKALKAIDRERDNMPFVEISPWREPINPALLLKEISDSIKRFIVCSEETVTAATLWVAMTWFIDVIQIAPLAVITAPEKRCGKSQMLFLLSRLVNRPLAASNITPAALFRSVDAWQPTLLIDEADTFMRENEELRGLINCGHTRESAFVVRVVGDDHTPRSFCVWGPKALAGIGHLADTIMDRAIRLALRRKLPEERVERLRHAEPGLFAELAAKLARFAEDYSEDVRNAKPELPEALNDRAQDNWEPLLAVAEIAGDQWPKLASAAALKISGCNEQSPSIGVELLSDIYEIFESQRTDRISSAELITALCKDQEKPWATYNRGNSITPRQIVSRLKEFGIISGTRRIGTSTAKGYLFSQFVDAFARYLPQSDDPSVTTSQTNDIKD